MSDNHMEKGTKNEYRDCIQTVRAWTKLNQGSIMRGKGTQMQEHTGERNRDHAEE
jgi:hypothetical protein